MPVLISLAVFAFVLYCVLDAVLTDPALVRNLPKPAWILVVVFLPVIGSIAWLIGGRPENVGRTPGGTGTSRSSSRSTAPHPPRRPTSRNPSSGTPRPLPYRRPRGPDDDPEFLRRIDERLRGDEGRTSDEG